MGRSWRRRALESTQNVGVGKLIALLVGELNRDRGFEK